MVRPRQITPKVLGVFGPTASGKSSLAVELASVLSGEVVSIDSVQVYKGFDIGSAKNTPVECRGIKHHMIDVFAPTEKCNAADFADRSLKLIHEIGSSGKTPILAGGTGLYLTSLIYGLDPLPRGTDDFRLELQSISTADLMEELKSHDPETAAKISPADRLRLERAVEILRLSGTLPSKLYNLDNKEPRVSGLFLVIVPERKELYRRIDERSSAMVQKGLLEETRNLVAKYGSDLPALETLGYRQAIQTINGELDADKLPAEIALHTRRFAKRQMTFWRNEPRKRGWLVRPEQLSRDKVGSGKGEGRAFAAFDWNIEALLDKVKQWRSESCEGIEVWFWGGAK